MTPGWVILISVPSIFALDALIVFGIPALLRRNR